eukprot:350844-Chlamydomonas_euryale.AAC.5
MCPSSLACPLRALRAHVPLVACLPLACPLCSHPIPNPSRLTFAVCLVPASNCTTSGPLPLPPHDSNHPPPHLLCVPSPLPRIIPPHALCAQPA